MILQIRVSDCHYMLEILYATGIRISELVGLKLGDISDDYSFIIILNKGRRENCSVNFESAKILKRYLNILQYKSQI